MAEVTLLNKITGSQPRVGMGVVVVHKDKVLMCRRDSGPENYKGKLHLFGGKLELGESMREGIIRELYEETGIDAHLCNQPILLAGVIEEIEPECVYHDDILQENRIYHWVSSVWILNVHKDYFENREPHKHYDMGWYNIDDLDENDLAPSAHKSLMEAGYMTPF